MRLSGLQTARSRSPDRGAASPPGRSLWRYFFTSGSDAIQFIAS